MRFLTILIAATCMAAQTTPDPAWDTLNNALRDSNPVKRIDALLAMAVIRPEPRVSGAVEDMLKDRDSGVRQAASTTLGEMKSRASVAKLREALNDSAPEVIFAAAKALYAMGDAAGREALIAVLTGDRPDASGVVSSSVRDAKLKLHDPKALLMVGINSGAGFLGPFGMGVPIAERLMKDNQASGKTVAALLLATDTTEESKEAVKTAMDDKNWTVRVAAIRAVALRDIKPFYSEVAAELDDKRDEVRYAAASAMIRLKQSKKH